MDLCHLKHSEQAEHLWKYKGRVVFRGDAVKDETGCYAVFSEQGSSASHMAATKFLDAIARLPGNTGEDADAKGAYHQVKLSEKILGQIISEEGHVETWISLPRNRRPASWDAIENPVCRL